MLPFGQNDELLQAVDDQLKRGIFGDVEKRTIRSLGMWNAGTPFKTLLKDPGPMFANEEPRMIQVTLLHTTALRGQCDLIEWLLEEGVDIEAVDDRMRTPLYYAVAGLSFEAVQLLARKGADPMPKRNEFCDCDESSALMALAVTMHNPDAIDIIRRFCDVDMNCHYHGQSFLTLAACKNDPYMIEHLLAFNRGMDVIDTNPVDDNTGRGLITEMVTRGYTDLLKTFLELGCSVNHVENDGTTALHHTVDIHRRHPAIQTVDSVEPSSLSDVMIKDDVWTAEILLNDGAHIDIRDCAGRTPLFRAVQFGARNVAKLLIDNLAPIDTPNNDGITAICVAASMGHHGLVSMLLENGANPFMYPTRSDIRSAFQWASRSTVNMNPSVGMRNVLQLLFYVENHIIETGMSTENKDGIYQRHGVNAHHGNSRSAAEFFNSMQLHDRTQFMRECIAMFNIEQPHLHQLHPAVADAV
jgi:ankyrin repeat protein